MALGMRDAEERNRLWSGNNQRQPYAYVVCAKGAQDFSAPREIRSNQPDAGTPETNYPRGFNPSDWRRSYGFESRPGHQASDVTATDQPAEKSRPKYCLASAKNSETNGHWSSSPAVGDWAKRAESSGFLAKLHAE